MPLARHARQPRTRRAGSGTVLEGRGRFAMGRSRIGEAMTHAAPAPLQVNWI
ncbi:MAG: hypothetical protein ACLSHC_12620 [Bilophila wadsworthia]